MTPEEFNVLLLTFHYRGHRADADQRVFEALSALSLVGYCSNADASEHLTVVTAELSIDEYEVPLTADAAGELSFTALKTQELADTLLDASAADSIYFDGELVAGQDLNAPDESIFNEQPSGMTPQVLAGKYIPRSELALSTMGHGGGWKLREDARGVLAVRTGVPVELILNRKMVPALEIIRHDSAYQIRLHARRDPMNFHGSTTVEYWMSLGDRVVPAVASPSPAAKLQQELGLWLKGVDQDELEALTELWPEAVEPLKILGSERTEAALREFVAQLGLPTQMVDLANGASVPEEFEQLRGGFVSGMSLAADEEIAGAKGPMKLLYRTGWSPLALISSSLGAIAAGIVANRWMKNHRKPSTGWRRTLMVFWYADAVFYLARGVRDVLGKKLKA